MKPALRARTGALTLAALTLTACGSNDIYVWRGYEPSVANLSLNGGVVDVDAEIAALEKLISRAATDERHVPPGAHAHLGYLYYLKGDVAGAVAGFEAEKAAYPEATTFVDGLLSRIRSQEPLP